MRQSSTLGLCNGFLWLFVAAVPAQAQPGTATSAIWNVTYTERSGLYINGGHFDASAGVLLHIVNDGVVNLAGNGNIDILPITDETNMYNGVSIFQSRTNYNEAVIIGTTSMNLLGTYYFPNNPVEIGGFGIALGNQLIAYTLHLFGTGEYTIAYDGQNPAPGYEVFLVD